MKYFYLIAIISTSLFAQVHYAKVEPYKVYTISSNTNGIVTSVNNNLEAKILHNEIYLQVDDSLDKKDLTLYKKQIKFLTDSLKTTKKSINNYRTIINKKENNYNKIKNLTVKSDVEKDTLLFDLLNSKNTLLKTLENRDNIKRQINDLESKVSHIQKSIHDKHFAAKGLYLYKIYAHEGEMLTLGKSVAKLYNLSKTKITLYLSKNEIHGIKNKIIYINNKRSLYKLDKIWKVTDDEHLSNYRAELYFNGDQNISEILKVEFLDE